METQEILSQDSEIAKLREEATQQQIKIRDLEATVKHLKSVYDDERRCHRYLEVMYEQLLDKVLDK